MIRVSLHIEITGGDQTGVMKEIETLVAQALSEKGYQAETRTDGYWSPRPDVSPENVSFRFERMYCPALT
jgi:hypothetical protein